MAQVNSCGVGKLDLVGGKYPMQQSVVSTQLVEIACDTTLPSSDVDDTLRFRISESAQDCIDLSQIYAYIDLQVFQADGTDLPMDANVAPCNMFGYALFSSVQMKINGEPITFNQKHYPWMVYTLNMLHMSEQQRQQYLTGSLYAADDPFTFENFESNQGAIMRNAYIGASERTELYFPILTDAHFIPKYLPAKTKVEFEFTRSPTAQILMHETGKEYKIRINEFKLYVAKSKLTKQSLELQDGILNRTGAIYPAIRYRINTLSVNKGLQNVDWTAFEGKLPRRVYIFSILQDAYAGAASKNLFNFQLPDIDSLTLFMNDERLPNNVGLPCKESNQLRVFYNTLQALNFKTDNMGLTRESFYGGYKIFCTDLSRDHSSDCNYISSPDDGQVRVVIDFTKVLENAIVIFAMGEYPAELNINSNREVFWNRIP